MAANGLQLIPERAEQSPRRGKELLVVEASLTPNSDMVGKTLRQVRFRETHGLNVLALWRQGAPVVKKVDHVVLRFGDVLLLQGDDAGNQAPWKTAGFLLLGRRGTGTLSPGPVPMDLIVCPACILYRLN